MKKKIKIQDIRKKIKKNDKGRNNPYIKVILLKKIYVSYN